MKVSEKVKIAVDWFMGATPEQQRQAVKVLFEYAIEGELVGVWHPEDREELAKESGGSIADYATPYYRSCGEPIATPEAANAAERGE